MIPECFGIIIIVIVLVIDLLRRRRISYALSTVPLIILPVVHLLALFFGSHTKLNADLTIIISDIAAAFITVALLAIRQMKFVSTKNRMLYLIGCTVYTVIVAVLLILFTINR